MIAITPKKGSVDMRARRALVRIGVPVVAAVCAVGLTSAPALAMTPNAGSGAAFESVSPKRCVLGGGHIVYRGHKYRGNRHRDWDRWVQLRCKGGRYSGESIRY
ncbi:hypothetical protein GCM10023321_05580 [Pseudonocardia eucalypti]|uniref:Uncharacterized protein n=1 Tax=Pseudonocardia eucalypti TaxID=648755 RepID=A0ABP9PII5_9PSEU